MGLSIWHLLLVLAIVLVLFGAKRLRNLGGDLGAAIKSFKDAVSESKTNEQQANTNGYDAATNHPQQIPQVQASTNSGQATASQSTPAQQPTQGNNQQG